MNSISENWPYPDLAKFEVVALGCHRKLHKELSRFFREKHGIEAFQLVEYFLREPVRRSEDKPSYICFPFLRRLLEHNIFQLRGSDEHLKVKPLTSDLRENVELEEDKGWYNPRRYVLPFDKSIMGEKVYKLWSKNNGSDPIPFQNWFLEYPVDQWKEHEDWVRQAPDEYRDIHLVEFNLAARFWMACAEGITTIVGGYPICSENSFYGYFVVVWPEPSSNSFNRENPTWGNVNCKNVVKIFQSHSENFYVPTLALLHNNIWEDKFHDIIKGKPGKDELKSAIDALPVGRWSTKAKDPLERGLANLWKKRKELLDQTDGIDAVKRTLLFRKYNIASPGMVTQVKKIIQRTLHLNQPDPGDKLPAALVYGEAGAGKDIMARLIQLFTLPSFPTDNETLEKGETKKLGYFGLPTNVINMSAMKPNALFGPLFQGMNVSGPHLHIPSILTLSEKPNIDKPKTKPGVYIFDELNSLDVDLQGVLLRILENGEVTPLFDIEPSLVSHLIIGIVNEDPDILMRENETKKLKQIKDLTGEVIGNALYEFSIKGRRLRPDLFYRLSRGLYIRLPSLRDRRDDIPILFYFECKEAVDQELKNTTINHDKVHQEFLFSSENCIKNDHKLQMLVELKAYESLMQPSIDWPGNVRQLQTVAMEVAIKSVKEYVDMGHKEKPGIIFVRDDTVCEVLNDHFPGVIEECAIDKSNERRNNGEKTKEN